MQNFLTSATLLVSDLASTLLFLAVLLTTKNLLLAVALGMILGAVQIGWLLARKKPIGTIQWLSVILVLSSGAATLLTNDARFVMAKPSVIYMIVGAVMLKPGWMNRYMPPIALATVPDLVYAFGFIWAGLMFASAALNVVLVLTLDATTWSAVISVYGIVSKLALFLIQYAAMNVIGRRRARMAAPA